MGQYLSSFKIKEGKQVEKLIISFIITVATVGALYLIGGTQLDVKDSVKSIAKYF